VTESEWLTCTDPHEMLDYLHEHEATKSQSGQRRFRLFACACCRSLWHLLPEAAKEAVNAAELYADGKINNTQRKAAFAKLQAIYQAVMFADRPDPLEQATTGMAVWAVHAPHLHQIASQTAKQGCVVAERELSGGRLVPFGEASEKVRRSQASMLRDIFGNSFRSVTFHPAWLTWHDGLLVSMAQKIYDSREFRDMPVLADALEEAGCDNLDILAHCRQPGEHVRGCWIVDLVLGKK
jgi:hypothetical protein